MNSDFANKHNFKNKVALITGSTGQLGLKIAEAFAANDATVVVTDLDINKCNALIKDLNKVDKSHFGIKLDVTSEESVMKAVKQIKKKGFKIDILINNAATAVFSSSEKRTKKEFMRVFEVNSFGTFNCIQKIIPLMKKNGTAGSVINIASIYGCLSSDPSIYDENDRKNSEIYSISKAGIIQMTKYFAVHYADCGIRFNSISPGGIFNNHNKRFYDNYSRRVPMKRMANENEIVGSVLFLADKNCSSYINGHNLVVDGGLSSW
jgi:NAD(P)-dependent dehydrogenase (short-subunit alcohol dehydrogenase family)|tara:strand:+ start:1174 stop:1965 length:792 start_codon:yes stop_codon:yes gene_type:complete